MSVEPHRDRPDPLFDISGKVALVTGGARGIGAFISEGLVRAGVRVVVASRDAVAAEAFAAGMAGIGDCSSVYSDLLAPHGAQRLADTVLEQSSRLDILVNNSGATSRAPLEAFTEQDWDSVMDLNVKAAFFLTAALAPSLREAATASDPSRVVNISSIAAVRAYDNNAYAYMASKAALNHMTRALAARLARDRINVNAVAPGPIAGGMMARTTTDDTFRQSIESRIPLGRTAAADDLVGAVRFLCAPASSYLTGVVLPLDGGASTCA